MSLLAIDAINQAAYNAIAGEYDSDDHRTTRALELLSLECFEELGGLIERSDRVLELGAGTGALTRHLLDSARRAREVVVTDLSRRMLDENALRHRSSRETARYEQMSAFQVGDMSFGEFGVIVAGLADPYALPAFVRGARQTLRAQGRLFISVPGRHWAEEERRLLGVPADRTRFRLHDGTSVTPYSFTYEADELRDLLESEGFVIRQIVTRTADISLRPGSRAKTVVVGAVGIRED